MIEALLFLNFIALVVIVYFARKYFLEFKKDQKASFDKLSLIEGNVFTKLSSRFDEIENKLKEIKETVPTRKNEIEKKEEEDIPITEEFRIPIGIPGLKVRFEGEDILADGQQG